MKSEIFYAISGIIRLNIHCHANLLLSRKNGKFRSGNACRDITQHRIRDNVIECNHELCLRNPMNSKPGIMIFRQSSIGNFHG